MKRWSVPAALLTALLMLTGALGAPASAAPADGTVYGYVYDVEGDSLSGASVDFFDQDPSQAPTATPFAGRCVPPERHELELV